MNWRNFHLVIRHPDGTMENTFTSQAWDKKFFGEIKVPAEIQAIENWWDIFDEDDYHLSFLLKEIYLFNQGEPNAFGSPYKGPRYDKYQPEVFLKAVRDWEAQEDMNRFIYPPSGTAYDYLPKEEFLLFLLPGFKCFDQ